MDAALLILWCAIKRKGPLFHNKCSRIIILSIILIIFALEKPYVGRELPDEKKAIVPIELAQIGNDEFVPIEMAQIPNVLFATGWSNHQLIMSRCKSNEQRSVIHSR